mmetsp:Transcript_82994/g.247591  ORF Transcript_82994/g.247591 Transcript_82994/m.247591 type:complete len:315 (+) Transcript_82994:335-1279(+)
MRTSLASGDLVRACGVPPRPGEPPKAALNSARVSTPSWLRSMLSNRAPGLTPFLATGDTVTCCGRSGGLGLDTTVLYLMSLTGDCTRARLGLWTFCTTGITAGRWTTAAWSGGGSAGGVPPAVDDQAKIGGTGEPEDTALTVLTCREGGAFGGVIVRGWTTSKGSASLANASPLSPSTSRICVDRSCVWLSTASQSRLFSFVRSSISLRIRLSKMLTVLCSESTRSLMVSWCLERSAFSACSRSSIVRRAAISLFRNSWCAEMCSSRCLFSFPRASYMSLCAASRAMLSRCRLCWYASRSFSRASLSRAISSWM